MVTCYGSIYIERYVLSSMKWTFLDVIKKVGEIPYNLEGLTPNLFIGLVILRVKTPITKANKIYSFIGY